MDTENAYQIRVFEEDGLWIAYHPEIEGCICQGITQAEAVDALHSTSAEFIQYLRDYQLPIPVPDTRCRMVVVQGARLCL